MLSPMTNYIEKDFLDECLHASFHAHPVLDPICGLINKTITYLITFLEEESS